MTNDQLDARIKECAVVVGTLVHDLGASETLEVEQAIAMGALLVCQSALEQLCCAADDKVAGAVAAFQAELEQLVRDGQIEIVRSQEEGS